MGLGMYDTRMTLSYILMQPTLGNSVATPERPTHLSLFQNATACVRRKTRQHHAASCFQQYYPSMHTSWSQRWPLALGGFWLGLAKRGYFTRSLGDGI